MHLLAVLGRLDEARAELERLAARDFEDLPRDLGWTSVMVELTEVCAAVGDRQRAAKLYSLLLPCAAYVVVTPYHATCWGSVARSLGILATMLEDWASAEAHFVVALERNRRLRARPWIARTQLDYARMLCRRDQPGDPSKAHALLDEAHSAATALGMRPLAEKIEAARLPLADLAAAASPAGAAVRPPEAAVCRFARKGDFWQIAFGSQSCSIKDSRGMQLIAQLLRYPHREIHVLELQTGSGGGAARSASSADSAQSDTDAGPLLDAQAKAEYKQRLQELGEELQEAEEFNDTGRIERLRDEIDFVTREISRAFGLGERERRAGSHAERARVNVTRAISAALRQIGNHDAELATHLKKTIKTGTFCSYNPDPRVPIDWQG
jgi:hypothetical protein